MGDFLFQQKCEDRIQELVQSDNTTVLLVSHSIKLVERMCDRVCWIEKGQQRSPTPATSGIWAGAWTLCRGTRNPARSAGRPSTPVTRSYQVHL